MKPKNKICKGTLQSCPNSDLQLCVNSDHMENFMS